MADEVGLPLVDRDWVSNSRKALEASEFAREQGMFDALHRAIFHAYFAEGRDIGKRDVLLELAREVGLDDAGLREALEDGRYRERIDSDYLLAQQIGFTGVPAFILGNRAIVGAQPYSVFEQVMELLGRDKRAADGSRDEADEVSGA